MNAALDRIVGILDGDVLAISCNAEMELLERDIKLIEPPQPAPFISDECDILTPTGRAMLEYERIYEETAFFTKPIPTTITMDGHIANVQMMEEELTPKLSATDRIVVITSNYGRHVLPGFSIPAKVRKSNRGRKKKAKPVKPRKKQGSGEEFNSQISFWVRRQAGSPDVYKSKVFRTGRLQLPGVMQMKLLEVIECAQEVTRLLDTHLQTGARLERIIPVMKNYKFSIKMPPHYILDLEAFKSNVELYINTVDMPVHPPLFMIDYVRRAAKLSMKFSTPRPTKAAKTTRVEIFMSGKVNILGACDCMKTHQICDYLHGVLERASAEIVVPRGDFVSVVVYKPDTLDDNIALVSVDTIRDMHERTQCGLLSLPDDFDPTPIMAALEMIFAARMSRLVDILIELGMASY